MRSILIFLFLSTTMISLAQKATVLEGQWKVVSIAEVISSSRDSLHYDLEKDEIYIPEEDMKEAAKDGLSRKETIKLFKDMYGSLKGLSFSFEEDSVIEEFRSKKAKGSFQINNNKLDMFLTDGEDTAHRI